MKPEHLKRVRLCGGPFINPRTHAAIKQYAKKENISAGAVIDRLASTVLHFKQLKHGK